MRTLSAIASAWFIGTAVTVAAGDVDRRDVEDANDQVKDSVAVVQKIRQDAELSKMLDRAKAVLIIPEYGQAAAVVGGAGGEGVALLRHADGWSAPAFYNIGGVTIGPQVGAEGGAIALLLMTDRSAKLLTEKNKFSLDAKADLTIIDWSAKAQESAGADVIAWSDTKGLFAGGAVGVSDINWDDDENEAYYESDDLSAHDVLTGIEDEEHAKDLREALATR
jgi:lipid-binding SYLF domain-containing protein